MKKKNGVVNPAGNCSLMRNFLFAGDVCLKEEIKLVKSEAS